MPSDLFTIAEELIPGDEPVEWADFVVSAIGRGFGYDKMSVEGLLLTLRNGGACTATGVPPTITRRPRPKTSAKDLRPAFTPTDNGSDLAAENAILRQRLENTQRRLAELERGR